MKKIAFFIAMTLSGTCSALELAQAYAEAGDTQAAIEQYQKLLDKKPPRWEQDVIDFNIGSLFLQQQKPKQAIRSFQKIPLKSIPVAEFTFRLSMNRALAHFLLAKQIRQTLSARHPIVPLEKARGELITAEIAMLPARRQKPSSPQVLALAQLVSQENRKIRHFLFQELVQSVTWNEGIAWLVDELALFSKTPFPSVLLQQLQSLDPLLVSLNARMAQANKSWWLAETALFSAIYSAQEGKIKQARSYLTEAMLRLQSFAKKEEMEKSRLLVFLKKNWLQDPIQPAVFQDLIAFSDPILNNGSLQVKELLERGKAAAAMEKWDVARLLYGAAMIELLNQLKPPSSFPPAKRPRALLQNLADQQRIAYHLGLRAKTGEQQQAVHTLERQILAQSIQFPKAVYAWQQKLFTKPNSGCLAAPWEQVFPYFLKGYEALSLALRIPESEAEKKALYQEEAFVQWQNALLAWFLPPSLLTQSQEEWQELWQQMQRMQAQDQTPLPIKTSTEKEGRPW